MKNSDEILLSIAKIENLLLQAEGLRYQIKITETNVSFGQESKNVEDSMDVVISDLKNIIELLHNEILIDEIIK